MIKIPYYEHSYFALSNFSAHTISFKGESYSTCEHAFHVQKFDDEIIRNEIKATRSPVEAFILGRKYKEKRRPDWDQIKLNVMYEILLEKVKQHSDVKECLLATGDEEIVEDSEGKFWGNGLDGSGENQCGKVWMKVRDEIRS